MDISFAAYISAFPLVIIAFSNFGATGFFRKFILYYTVILIIINAVLSVTDLEIFKWWGFRIDSTLFKYLKSPAEAAASASVAPVFWLIILIIASSVLLVFLYVQFIEKRFSFTRNNIIKSIASFFGILAIFSPMLIAGIRGGIQQIPMNQSGVCFSDKNLLNQAAINTPWNFCFSITESSHETENPFVSLPNEEAIQHLQELYPLEIKSEKIIKNGKLNVILILWESFTAKSVESLGGRKGITPGFEKLIKEGVFFNNIYASGNRSDKGLIAVLSAFPAQPNTSIIIQTKKATRLPSITNTFRNNGYKTSFYYGGEAEFANIKSYLLNSGFEKIVAKENFPPESWNSKWGAHDEVVFEKLLNDLKGKKDSFFSTLFTLSSHEPFEIPSTPFLKGEDEETLFLNSLHYTDSCLYDFIEKAKKESWWDNTLIVITADHGHRLPGTGPPTHLPEEFKIPMLWLGGALLKRDTIVSITGNQTDLAKTLLNQFNFENKEFIFSKDLFSPTSIPFSYYCFNNGFGFISEEGKFVFDNISQSFILKDFTVSDLTIMKGKSYLQLSYQEYLNK
jgi:phosphoglycerol transferase MdoB-like AlkP superfamily enzyme